MEPRMTRIFTNGETQTIDLSLYTFSSHFGAGEESRAKDAKDAKGRGMEDEEIAGVVEEGAFALRIQMPWR